MNRLSCAAAGAALALSACASNGSQPAVTPSDPGYVALERGDYETARAAFTKEVAAHPNDPYLQLNLALADQMTGHMDQAEPLYRAVLASGRGLYPGAITTDGAAGMSLDQIACQNLRAGLRNPNAC